MNFKSTLRIGTLVGLLLAIIAAGCRREGPAPVLPIGGDFTLTDHNGQPFELSSLRGKVVLLFFGYTYCPNECPTTLGKLSSVYSRLGQSASSLKTLYVTVDPDRDTPEVLKADLSYFAIDALGLTGTREQIDKVVRQYAAAYQIVPAPESKGRYTVAHTTTLYALDKAGQTRLTFPYQATVDQIVKGLEGLLDEPASGQNG